MNDSPDSQQPENFDELTGRLRSERPQLTGLEHDRLRTRLSAMSRAQRKRTWLFRLSGYTRWAVVAGGLAIAAGATGGTIVAVGGGGGFAGTPLNAACEQYASKINYRFHYSANGSSGGFSGTTTWSPSSTVSGCQGAVSIGPQAMEGNLQIPPGTTVNLGYDFTVPGNKTLFTVTTTPSWTLYWSCPSNSNKTVLTTSVAGPTGSQTFSDSNWYPTGNQSGATAYENTTTAPSGLCGTGNVSLNNGVLFTASVTAS